MPMSPVDAILNEAQSNPSAEGWFKHGWRPFMAWLYAMICFFDFVGAPMFSMILPIITKAAYVAWVPLTLSNGGLIHLSFGAIIGLYTWQRSQEKIAATITPPTA